MTLVIAYFVFGLLFGIGAAGQAMVHHCSFSDAFTVFMVGWFLWPAYLGAAAFEVATYEGTI